MKQKITILIVVLLTTLKLFAGAVAIPIASGTTVAQMNTDMAAAVTAGNTDITLQFAKGGTWGSTGTDITIAVPAGVTKLTFTADPATTGATPVLYLNTLTYADGLMTDGIVFDGVKLITAITNRYLITPTSTLARIPAKITIKNCWVEGYRSVFSSTLATVTTELIYINSVFKNLANEGAFRVSVGTIQKVTIRNNTFINVGGDASGATGADYFIDFRSPNSVTSQINFSNNTIYYPRTQGRGLFRLAGQFTTGFIKENNNLYSTGNATSFALQLLYTNVTAATTDTDSTNYYSNKMTLGGNKGSMIATPYVENDPSNLFVNPAADNFTINDPNFVGKIKVGNPSCFFPATVNITGSNLVNFNYNVGSGPSTEQTFTFSTIVLRGAVTLTAPANYEISTDNSTYTGTLTLGGLGNDLTNQTIYVRLKAGLSLGTYNESITVSTTQAADQYVTCSGAVTIALPALETPSGLSSSAITYTGFHASWAAVANASSYTIRVLLNGSAVQTITGISGAESDITGLTPGSTYAFAVTAVGDAVNYNNSLESSPSESITTPLIYLNTSVNISGAGSVTKNPNTTTYSPNASVQLTATRNFGYNFVKWVDTDTNSDIATTSTITVTMDGTKNIQAVFVAVTTFNYTVSVDGSQWGTVSLSPAPTGGKYEEGTVVSMTAVNDSVSTFLNWEDATTGKVRSITVDGDKTFTATFSEKAFIVGWDLVTPEPKSSRPGDYYSKAANKGVFSAYEPTGTAVNWLTYTGGGIPCGLLWTSNLSTRRYFKASFSTTGYKNINVHSNMFAYNQAYYTGQKMQYSTDGTNFTDLASCTLTASNWKHFPATLPVELEDQPMVYLRWIADETSTPVGSGNDGTGISNIYVFAEEIATFDPVKPTLVSTIPTNNSTGASANGSITLTFDKNVKAGTGNCTLESTVLTPVFGSKTATFNYTKLAYNTTYTFTVPAGALTNVDGVAFEGTTVTFTTMNRPQPTAKLFDAVVAKDGSGDYTSVIAAINAAPTGRTQPWLIFVKNGTYSGHLEIPANKPYINLIGQSRDNVIISDARLCGTSETYPDSAVYSVDPGATVVVKSANCYFENICFENKFGYDNLTGPQALALYTQNDRTILNNCWLRSYQDTYLTTYNNVAYRHYVKDCRIEGAVDFIYGGGDVFFDKCTLYVNRSAGGFIVAPSHQTGTAWGYVFSNCTIDGPSPSYITYLGRPWVNSPKASFLNTTAKINIYPEGWLEHMGAIPAIFADYNTVDGNGDLTDMSARIDQYWIGDVSAKVWGTAKKSFTDEEAATYTLNNVLTGSDAWDPMAVVEKTENPSNVINTSGTLTWNTTPYAISYVILRDNVVIGFTTENTFIDTNYSAAKRQMVNGESNAPAASVYKVVAVSESGALSSPTIAAASGGTTGLENPTSGIYAYINNNNLIVNNLEIGSTVSVYSFNGMLFNKQIAKTNTVSVPVESSCIVKVTTEKETVSLKVIK